MCQETGRVNGEGAGFTMGTNILNHAGAGFFVKAAKRYPAWIDDPPVHAGFITEHAVLKVELCAEEREATNEYGVESYARQSVPLSRARITRRGRPILSIAERRRADGAPGGRRRRNQSE